MYDAMLSARRLVRLVRCLRVGSSGLQGSCICVCLGQGLHIGQVRVNSQIHHLFGLLGVQAIRLVKELLAAVHNVSQRVEGSALVMRPDLHQILMQLRQVLEFLYE